ncbi:hypothetical protein NW759_008896 [Fusarium solani]|nr:hypothetical protein NW759_008896 [Fusarium solani]
MNPHQIVERPRRVRLPIEILVMIVELPIQKDSKAILRASDPITKWLLAFTRVCKATYPTASKLLWRYCLCIDSKQRALDFMRFLANPLYYPPRDPWKVRDEARLFLAPFPQQIEPQDSDGESEPEVPSAPEEAEPQTIEPQEPSNYGSNPSRPMNSADSDDSSEVSDSSDDSSVRSFIFRYPPSPLNDLETARTTHGILATLAPILKTLIIDMPLRSLHPSNDEKGIRKILRRGFEALVNLEEFVSVHDNLFLAATLTPSMEENVWSTYWPKLRRLSLFGQEVDEALWATMAKARHLETVILSGPTPHYYQDPGWDIKGHWFEYLPGKRRYPRKLSLVLLNCTGQEADLRRFAASWKKLDPKNRLNIRNFTIQAPLVKAYDGEMETWPLYGADLCQHWITEKALDGTLWKDVQKKHEAWLRDPGPLKRRKQYY